MRNLGIILLSISFFTTLQANFDTMEVSPVILLTDKTFEDFVNPSENGRWFVFFYSSDCATCMTVTDAWKKLGKE